MTRSPDDLSRLQASFARLEGRRDAMIERARALTAAVELAKGRLAVRPEVEAFIEGVHEDASRRSLVNLETLLTALVQEVLPGEKPVRLDLATERGLASLNICVARPDGALEDVLEDNGGALTNVVGTALRLVAVVKAGVGRFLALDEADCWIAPERVPAFYRVMVDGAARLGVQCLAVSHHDLSALSDEVHVSRVEGRPEEGVRIVADGSEPTWDEGRAGLRFVRLVDVQAYRDATLRLSPGVNALVGPNNRGKSTFIRALRAVFYGEARDSLVRAGARSALVEIGVAGGRTLRFTRRPGRSPVNVWSLHDADGSVVEEGGLRHETGGRAVPPWVEDLVRINRVEGLDVHISHQKFPVFLLGEPASRRSAVLSIGQEASYVRDMLALHRERCAKDAALVRSGERELAEISGALARLDALEPLRARLAEAAALAADLRLAADRTQALGQAADGLARGERGLARVAARRAALSRLPEPESLEALRRAREAARAREAVAREGRDAGRRLERALARREILRGLPDAPPRLEGGEAARRSLRELRDLAARGETAAAHRDRAQAALDELKAGIAELVGSLEGRCPTCGAEVDADALLEGRHGPQRKGRAAA